MPDDYDLQPVEYVPTFAEPFAIPQTPVTPEQTARFREGVTSLFKNTVGAPGVAAQPIVPETPGFVSDVDVARQIATDEHLKNWAPQQALNMVGQGAPGAVKGAAGIAGGKLATKAADALRDVRRPRENIDTVLESNFNHGREIGNDTAKVSDLNHGTSVSATDAKKVDRLASQMSSPEGYWERPIVDDANNVIEGQHRIAAAERLGLDEVPVYRVKDLERDMPVDAMRKAINDVQKTHSDQVHGIMSQTLDMIHEAGGAQKALQEYEFPPEFKTRFEAALKAAEPTPPIRAYHGSPHDFELEPVAYDPFKDDAKHAKGGAVKLSHASVGYMAQSTHLPQKCGRCTMFLPPSGCTLVQSPIKAGGWCRRFEKE